MKRIAFLQFSIVLLFGTTTTAQDIPLSVGYYGHYLIEPGMVVGSTFDLKQWEKSTSSEGPVKTYTLFVKPSVGLFTNPGNRTSYTAGTDVGIRRVKSNRKTYSSLMFGIDYLVESELLDLTVDLGSGDITNKNRETRHYILPAISYEFGKAINDRLGWYNKYTLGHKLNGQDQNAMVMFVEVGVNFWLKKNKE